MKLRSATAIALALGLGLGLASVSSPATAGAKDAETPGVGKLPGNTGNEGAGGGFARDENLIDSRDPSDKSDREMSKDEERLPGNVGNEGNAGGVASPSESDYNANSGASSTTPTEEKLPGNVNNEGAGKTK